jgi:Caspase domain
MAKYALVIGIAQYDHFANLPKAATDAEAIAHLLEQHHYTVIRLPRKLVAENQWAIAPDKQLTLADLSGELRLFLSDRADRQEALIYFAGHGFRTVNPITDEQEGYLAASDSTRDGRNAVRIEDLNALLGKADLSSLMLCRFAD